VAAGVSALRGTTVADNAALIAEVEAAVAAANENAEQARARALDPLVVDRSARAEMADAKFFGERLGAALRRLQARLQRLRVQEYAAAWEPDFKQVAASRDSLAAEFAQLYPSLVSQLIGKPKPEGVYKGRRPSIDSARVKSLRSSGMGAVAPGWQRLTTSGSRATSDDDRASHCTCAGSWPHLESRASS
jgi:hypothetical protein